MTPSSPEPDADQPSAEELSAEDRKQRIVVLTARKAEYEDVLSDDFSQKLVQNHAYWAYDTDDFEVRISHTGVGPDQTEKTLGKLQSMLEGDLLVIAGTAGALHDDIEEGDVFVPTALAPTDAIEWEHPDQQLLHWMAGWLTDFDFVADGEEDGEANLRMGPMVTSPRPVVDPEQREELQNLTGAMAVDMESAHVLDKFDQSQDEADQWVGIRVISDGPDTPGEAEAEAQQPRACQRLNQLLNQLIYQLS